MEVRLMEEHTCGRREPVLVSQSIPLSKEFDPIKIVDDGNKKEGKICEHFSIRGYVADIRKKNTEICWPFSMLHNPKLYEDANLFPPLSVSKFQRWNCEHCLHAIDPFVAVVANRDEGHIQNDEVKGVCTSLESTILASQSSEELLLPGFQQISEGEMIREKLLAADSSIGESNVESCPKVCFAKKENESAVKDLTREGLDIPKAGHDICEMIRTLESDTVITEGREHSGEGTVVLTTNTFRTVHDEGTPNLLHAKTIGIESLHKITGSDMTTDPTFAANGVSGRKQYNDIARNVHEIDSMQLDESNQDSCNNDMGQTKYISQIKKRASETLIADKHRRKARKVRLLDDILRSEGLDVISKQICSPTEEAKDGRNEDDNARRPYTCKGKYIDCKSDLADKKTQVEPSTCRERHTHRGHTKIKPKQTTNASAGKRLDCFHDFSGAQVHKSKVFLRRKKKEMPWCSINSQQKTMNGINLSDSVDAATNIHHTKVIDPQFKGILVSPQALHHGSKIRDNSHSKNSMHKNKDKAPQVGDGEYCQVHLSKESKRVPKKKRTGRVSKQIISDDIPMDIVELLARNQHQRRLMEAKAATTPKIIDKYSLDAADDHGKMVADAVPNGFSQRKNLSCSTNYLGNSRIAGQSPNGAKHSNLDMNSRIAGQSPNGAKHSNLDMNSRIVGHSNLDMNSRIVGQSPNGAKHSNLDMNSRIVGQSPNGAKDTSQLDMNSRIAGQSLNGAKHTSHLDMNKDDVLVSSIRPLVVPEYRIHPMNHADSPNYYSSSNYLTQNSSRSRERLPIPESCHIDHRISTQKLGMKSHGLSWMPVNLKTVTPERGNQKLVNQDGSHLLNINEQAELSIGKRASTAATSFAELGNTLYPNQPTPPIRLLNLTNAVAWPGTSHNSVDTNKSGFNELSYSATDQRCHGFAGLMGRVGTPQTHVSSLLVGPQWPLPRVGVFGSSLQKEIASRANTCATQIGPGVGYCSKFKCHEPKKKPERPYLGTHIRLDGQRIPVSGYENTKQLLNNQGTQFGAKIGNFDHLRSFETKGKEKSVSSHMAASSKALSDQTPIYTNGNINHMISRASSITGDMIQVNINSAATVQSPKTDICVMNRNPADFTILDEDNVYMIPCEGLNPRN